MAAQPFATIGKKTDQVVVSISYRIIELFSGGLYSSPNKAVEELVTNAYDALATEVRLLVPANVAAEDATIWVIDNGESMDVRPAREPEGDGRLPGMGEAEPVELAERSLEWQST